MKDAHLSRRSVGRAVENCADARRSEFRARADAPVRLSSLRRSGSDSTRSSVSDTRSVNGTQPSGGILRSVLTCFPRITMTSAAPAAVRAHVNKVPRSAWVIGEWSLIIANLRHIGRQTYDWSTVSRDELPCADGRGTRCGSVRECTNANTRAERRVDLRALSPPRCLSQPPREPPRAPPTHGHRATTTSLLPVPTTTNVRPSASYCDAAVLVRRPRRARASIATSEYRRRVGRGIT